MRGLPADINLEGHFQALLAALRTDPWREFWNDLGLATPTFADVGLPARSSDLVVWQTCQREQLILVTANRNARTPDSLEATLRAFNQADSLPFFTVAQADRLLLDRSFAERAAIRALGILQQVDRFRGAGRLYIP